MTHSESASTLFHNEIIRGIYQISSTLLSPTGDAKSLAPGEPTRNSYLVVGETQALLFDLALEEPELVDYATKLAGRPLTIVLSHGHDDHMFNITELSEVWVHPAEEALIREGFHIQPPVSPCPKLHFLKDGDSIDLGDRILDVIHIEGHTPGSILLLDRQTGTLLSGDSISRRLLYGLHGDFPLHNFCERLRYVGTKDFSVAYSTHDRCGLPKAHLELMLDSIENGLPNESGTVELPGLGTLSLYATGDIYRLRYFDIAIPSRYVVN